MLTTWTCALSTPARRRIEIDRRCCPSRRLAVSRLVPATRAAETAAIAGSNGDLHTVGSLVSLMPYDGIAQNATRVGEVRRRVRGYGKGSHRFGLTQRAVTDASAVEHPRCHGNWRPISRRPAKYCEEDTELICPESNERGDSFNSRTPRGLLHWIIRFGRVDTAE